MPLIRAVETSTLLSKVTQTIEDFPAEFFFKRAKLRFLIRFSIFFIYLAASPFTLLIANVISIASTSTRSSRTVVSSFVIDASKNVRVEVTTNN